MTGTAVEKWGMFEASFEGPSAGNPYLDVDFEVRFQHLNREVTVAGFYDGSGVYRVRFMPDTAGSWSFTTASKTTSLNAQRGSFEVTASSPNNHGPVHVRNKFHFAYADETPYLSFGTTCYAWTHQPVSQQQETLDTLESARFNKMRMCVFPKDYPYNTNEPLHLAYEAASDGKQDFDQPNYAFFQHFDSQVSTLGKLGIEADVILFHPYDRWGYCDMSPAQDERYVAYIAARLGGFRHVWWSLANEYDFLLNTKPMELWDRFFKILEENETFYHLKSIHNGDPAMNYDHRKVWVTHVCIQHPDVKRTQEWRDAYEKPVVNDEPEYEGNISLSWGNLSAQELVHRYWLTMLRGGYAGHGETYEHPEDLLWWAKGGKLHGEAYKRIGFLRDLLEEDVKTGLTPLGRSTDWPWGRVSGAIDGDVRYIYFGEHQPSIWSSGLPQDDDNYEIDIIDTWNMTVERVEKVDAPQNHPTRHGDIVRPRKPDAAFAVALPGRPHLAIRIRKLG